MSIRYRKAFRQTLISCNNRGDAKAHRQAILAAANDSVYSTRSYSLGGRGSSRLRRRLSRPCGRGTDGNSSGTAAAGIVGGPERHSTWPAPASRSREAAAAAKNGRFGHLPRGAPADERHRLLANLPGGGGEGDQQGRGPSSCCAKSAFVEAQKTVLLCRM